MYYGNIKPCSIENGPGVRVSFFVSGCRHHCKDCFSPQTWNFTYGNEYTEDTKNEIISLLEPTYVKGLTILGGEPFEPENQEIVLDLVKTAKELFPQKSIWMYSGFTFEEVYKSDSESRSHTNTAIEILKNIDVLVDGEFKTELKNLSLSYRGSENQRILDIPRTLEKFDTIQDVELKIEYM